MSNDIGRKEIRRQKKTKEKKNGGWLTCKLIVGCHDDDEISLFIGV